MDCESTDDPTGLLTAWLELRKTLDKTGNGLEHLTTQGLLQSPDTSSTPQVKKRRKKRVRKRKKHKMTDETSQDKREEEDREEEEEEEEEAEEAETPDDRVSRKDITRKKILIKDEFRTNFNMSSFSDERNGNSREVGQKKMELEAEKRRIATVLGRPEEQAENTTASLDSLVIYKRDDEKTHHILRDRNLSDVMGLLCIDSGIRQVEVPGDEGTSITPAQRFSDTELMQKLAAAVEIGNQEDGEEDELVTEEVFDGFLDPGLCEWTTEEWVLSWMLIATVHPLKLLAFFADADELNLFLSDLWKRGASRYHYILSSEHTRGWTIHMLLANLHGTFFAEFTEYATAAYDKVILNYTPTMVVRNTTSGGLDSLMLQRSKKPNLAEFKAANMLLSMQPCFNSDLYGIILAKMGIVPLPYRPPYKMDLIDISLTLSTIGRAWRTWDFWFGYQLAVSSAEFDPNSPPIFSRNPLKCRYNSQTVTTRSSCFRGLILHVYYLMDYLDTYLYWIYSRFIEICSHESMDPRNTKVKENLFFISGLLGLFQTMVNLFMILFEEKGRGLLENAHNLKALTRAIYTSDAPTAENTKVGAKLKIEKTAATRASDMLPNVQALSNDLVLETLEIAKHGAICDFITTTIDEACTPLHTNVMYHSRSGGFGMNIKSAPRETTPRSSQVNKRDFLEIVEGSVEKIKGGLPKSMHWSIDFALQLQSIDSCMGQFVPQFKWSEKYMIYDTQVPSRLKDMRPWPRPGKDGMTKTVSDLMEDLENRMIPPSKNQAKHPSMAAFRDTESSTYVNLAIIKFGCLIIVHGYGHSFITPCLCEAFCAWCLIKDAYEGWTTHYYISYIAEDRSHQKKIAVCNLETAVKYILHSQFKDAGTFQEDISDDIINRLQKKMGKNRADNRKGLSEQDIMAEVKTIERGKGGSMML